MTQESNPTLGDKDIVNLLQVLMASIDMICIKTRGYTYNVLGESFYEYHSFLNLTIENLHKQSYNVAERIRSLDATANFSLDNIETFSVVKDATAVVSDFSKMVKVLLSDYQTISDLARDTFKAAGEVADAGTIACVTSIALKFEHFAWELKAMAS
jgi:starvation-inducible DNA-binding protein